MLKEITVASAVVALLVLSGCGSDNPPPEDGTPEDAGIVIPDALSQKADVNDSTAGEFMHRFYKNLIYSSTNLESKAPVKGLRHIKSESQPADGSGDSNVTITNQACSEGGTFSFKREITKTTEGDMNITTRVIECIANNCKMNASDYSNNDDYIDYCEPDEDYGFWFGATEPQVDNSIRTYNGSSKVETKEGESADGDAVIQKDIWEVTAKIDNLTYTKENNTSDEQRYKFSNGESWTKWMLTDSNVSHKIEEAWKGDYAYKDYDRNKTAPEQIFEGRTVETKVNWVWGEEADDTSSKRTFVGTGYILLYGISGSESNKTIRTNSFAYDNVTYERVREGNVTTENLDGGINEYRATCGKMINITTDKTVKHNRTFKDIDGNTGSSVLPYDGKVTLKGNGTAEATFNVDDENKTSMTLEIDGTEAEDSPYGKWDDVPRYDCDAD